jgi:uncharacterized protein (TIGR03437 family)
MRLTLALLFWASWVTAAQTPYLSVAVPPQDIPVVNLRQAPLYVNWEKGEMYLVTSTVVTVIKTADGSILRTIPIISDGASCVSPSGLMGTMMTNARTFQVTVKVVNLEDGTVDSMSPSATKYGVFYGGGSCAFWNGLLYLSSTNVGSNPGEKKIIAIDPLTMQVVNTWVIGKDYIRFIIASDALDGGVFVVQEHSNGYAPSDVALGKIDASGNYVVLNPTLPTRYNDPIFVGPNGHIYIDQISYSPEDGTPDKYQGGLATSMSWPINNPWYVYETYHEMLGATDITISTNVIDLAMPGQTYVGVVSQRQADGTDLVIAWRASGFLDYYKVTPPKMGPAISTVTTVMYKDASKGLAPGSFAVLWGNELTGFKASIDIPLPPNIAGTIPFPNKLAASQVRLCGQLVPMQFARTMTSSVSQINFIVPNLPTGPCVLVVERLDISGLAVESVSQKTTLNIVPVAPTFFGDSTDNLPTFMQFWKDPTGRTFVGQSTGTSPKGRLTERASAGDFLILYATGLGATTPAVTPGDIPPAGVTAWVNAPVSATLKYPDGSQQFVTVLGDGRAAHSPQFVGLYQVAIQLPNPLLANDQATLLITVGEVQADPITIYLK